MKYLIYGLVDPRTLMVRYVGCSSTGMKRPGDHRKPGHLVKDRSYKANWIRSLHAQGLTYEVVTLAESTVDNLKPDEQWWIAYGRACGWPLTNLTDGGDGTLGYSPGEYSRRRTSETHRGKVVSEETRDRISKANTGRKQTDQARLNMSIAHTGKKQPAWLVKKRAAAMRGKRRGPQKQPSPPLLRINLMPRPTCGPRTIPPEVHARMIAASVAKRIGRPLQPEHIARIAAKNRGKIRTAEQRARMSVAKQEAAACVTHCPHGHEYTTENTRLKQPGNRRECRQCGRDYEKRKRHLFSQNGAP